MKTLNIWLGYLGNNNDRASGGYRLSRYTFWNSLSKNSTHSAGCVGEHQPGYRLFRWWNQVIPATKQVVFAWPTEAEWQEDCKRDELLNEIQEGVYFGWGAGLPQDLKKSVYIQLLEDAGIKN